MDQRSDLTRGSILRPLVALAAPFMLGHVFALATLVVDRFWVGRVGTSAMAALGTAHAALMVCYTVAMGMAVGTLAGVARAVGSGRPRDASVVLGQGLLVSLVVGLGFAGLAMVLPEPVIAFLGAGADTASDAEAYLRIMMWGLLAHAPLVTVTFALQGAGEARAALAVSVVAPIANAILDPLLIFGLGMGMPGAAWASVSASVVGLAASLYLVVRARLRVGFDVDCLRLERAVAWRVVAVGVPGSLEHMVRTVAGFSLVKILHDFGDVVVAAYTTAMMITMTLIFPGLALGQATASLVGQNLGAGEPRRAWTTAWAGAGLYTALMVVLGVALFLAAAPLMAVFLPGDAAAIAEGARLMRVVVTCFPFLALALVLSKAFGGAGTTVPAMVAAAVAHVAFQIPAAWWLGQQYGPVGAYWAMAGAFGLHGVLSAVLFVRRFGPAAMQKEGSSSVPPA